MFDIDSQWQADLVDLQHLSRWNQGYKYLLTCIDVLSKYAWVVPLKSKTGASLVVAFESIFQEGRKTEKLRTDAGTDGMVPLGSFRETLLEEREHIVYLPLRTKIFQTIEIHLTSGYGQTPTFLDGIVSVVLHFRRPST